MVQLFLYTDLTEALKFYPQLIYLLCRQIHYFELGLVQYFLLLHIWQMVILTFAKYFSGTSI